MVLIIILLVLHVLLCIGGYNCYQQVKKIPDSKMTNGRVWFYYVIPILGPIALAIFSVFTYIMYNEFHNKSNKK